MFRALGRLVGLFLLAAGGAVGLYVYSTHNLTEQKLREAEAKNAQLQQVVQRLTDEARVAEVLVTEQKPGTDGVLETTLLFVETARDGSSLTPRQFKIRGQMIHVAAQVIRFDPQFLKDGDPLRGHSIALFTSIYGDAQKPSAAERIDRPGEVPDLYRGADPRVTSFEQDLWKDFWRLFNDESYRKEKGVATTFGQDVWGPFQPDKLYTITLEANGALSLTSSPLKSIYREALRQRLVQ